MKSKWFIARRVRGQLEKYSTKSQFSTPERLAGLCAIGSALLAKEFREAGYDAKVIWGRHGMNGWNGSHCWVISDNEIWDVTATQFEYRSHIPKVVKTTTKNRNYSYIMKRDLSIYKMTRWPTEQKPYAARLCEIMKL